MSDPSTGAPRPGARDRTAAQIRADIDAQQAELSTTMTALRGRVTELTDWRSQIEAHREQLITGAAVAGFVIGGFIAFRRMRRR